MYSNGSFVGYGVRYIGETFKVAVLCMFCEIQIFTPNRKENNIKDGEIVAY